MNTNIANLNEPRLNYRKVSPTVLQALWGVQKAVNESGLEHALQELVKLRASQLNGCTFCIDMHYRDALKAGETEQRLFLLNAGEEAPVYTPRERAALRWPEALTKTGREIKSSGTFAYLENTLTAPQLNEFLLP